MTLVSSAAVFWDVTQRPPPKKNGCGGDYCDLDITNILVLSFQIRHIEVFDIANPPFNEQIWPVPSNFVKSRFHCNYQLCRNRDIPKDTLNCFEVWSQYIMIATMNRNFSVDALSKIYTVYTLYLDPSERVHDALRASSPRAQVTQTLDKD